MGHSAPSPFQNNSRREGSRHQEEELDAGSSAGLCLVILWHSFPPSGISWVHLATSTYLGALPERSPSTSRLAPPILGAQMGALNYICITNQTQTGPKGCGFNFCLTVSPSAIQSRIVEPCMPPFPGSPGLDVGCSHACDRPHSTSMPSAGGPQEYSALSPASVVKMTSGSACPCSAGVPVEAPGTCCSARGSPAPRCIR
jgi:hypothetical protein